MPKIHSDHRRRKNGASREAWEKKKAATNAARGTQVRIDGKYAHISLDKS